MIEQIPLSRLRKSEKNVRKTPSNPKYIELLAQSLLDDGQLQNLVGELGEDGFIEITAGGRRLEAYSLLRDTNRIPAEHLIDVKVQEQASPAPSLKENRLREGMHPVDEFEAFAAISTSGNKTPKEIAAEFGESQKFVKQRLRLALVHPTLRQACREGKFDIDVLEAFTLTDDQEQQLRIYESVGSRYLSANQIRQSVIGKAVTSDSPLVKLVGAAAYRKAGGMVVSDLFHDRTHYQNPEILNTLAQAKLDQLGTNYSDWKWVKTDFKRDYDFVNRCRRAEPTETAKSRKLSERIEAIEQEIDALDEKQEYTDEYRSKRRALSQEQVELEKRHDEAVTYSKTVKSTAGVYIYIEHGGGIGCEVGLILPEDRKAQSRAGEAGGTSDITEVAEAAGISKALQQDALAYRLAAAKVAHAQHADFDVLFSLFLCEMIRNRARRYSESALALRPEDTFRDTSRQDLKGSSLVADLHNQTQSQLAALEAYKSLPDLYAAVRELDGGDRQRLFAVLMAHTIVYPSLGGGRLGFVELTVGSNLRIHWSPTADNLFGRVSAKELRAWGPEVFGSTWQQRGYEKLAKKDLVPIFDAFFNGENSHLSPEQLITRAEWLPEFMRPNLNQEASLEAYDFEGEDEEEADTGEDDDQEE